MDRSSCSIHFIRLPPDAPRFQSHTAPLWLCGQAWASIARCQSASGRAKARSMARQIEFSLVETLWGTGSIWPESAFSRVARGL